MQLDFDEEPPAPDLRQRIGWGVRLGAAGGLLFGGSELLVHGLGLALPQGVGGWLMLSLWVATVDLAFGAGLALLVGALVHMRLGGDPPVRVGLQVGIVAWIATVLTLGERIVRLFIEGQVIGTIVLGLVPFIIATGAGIFARIVCRRWWYNQVGYREVWPVERWALALAVLGALIGGVANQLPPQPGPLKGKPPIVLVSVDGWRADANSPLSALVEGGLTFTEAVSPTPGSRAANTTLLTGLHPLRHHVLREGSHLSRGHTTLFELLAEQGYETAAFVSSSSVESGTGLDQGFHRFDDHFSLARRSAVARAVLAVLAPIVDPAYSGRFYTRPAEETAAAFARWVKEREDGVAWAAWIQLADPWRAEHGASVSPQSMARSAAQIAEVLPKDALIVLVGTHGVLSGEHGGRGNRSLYDAVVHIPLQMKLAAQPPAVSVISPQVRLMDIAQTIFDAAGLPEMPTSEGVSLVAYGTGFRKASLSTTLVGQDFDGRWLIGVRNNAVKVIVWPEGRDELYLLDQDPKETKDRRADQGAVLEQARSLLASDRAALAELVRLK